MGLFDWLGDALGGSSNISGTPVQPGPGAQVGELDPMGSPTGQMMPMPTGASMPSNPYPLNDVGVGMDSPQLPTPQNTPESSFGQGAPPGLMYPPAEDPMQSGGMNPGGLPAPAPAAAPGPARAAARQRHQRRRPRPRRRRGRDFAAERRVHRGRQRGSGAGFLPQVPVGP
jgi:hypothetical protein